VEWIAAHSPQAKGRIERSFKTAQDRLVKGLRRVGAKDLERANAYLEQVFLPLWNERFRYPPQMAGDASCSAPEDESGFGVERAGEPHSDGGLHGSLAGRDLSNRTGAMAAGGCIGESAWWHGNAVRPHHGCLPRGRSRAALPR
jgi:hypothetical protein